MKILVSMIQLKCFISLNVMMLQLHFLKSFFLTYISFFSFTLDQYFPFLCCSHTLGKQNQGHILQGEDGDAVRMCRDGIREVKAQLELNLARNMKTDQKGSYRYAAQKKEDVFPTINKKRELLKNAMKKFEVLKPFSFCSSVFTGNLSSYICHIPKFSGRDWRN